MIQALHSFIYIHLSHIYPLISVCQGPCCICYLVSPAFSVIRLLLSAVTSLTVMVILYFDYFLFYFKDQDDHVSYFGFTSCFCFFLPFMRFMRLCFFCGFLLCVSPWLCEVFGSLLNHEKTLLSVHFAVSSSCIWLLSPGFPLTQLSRSRDGWFFSKATHCFIST